MNWDLLGHEWAVDLLTRQLAQGQLRHAYLITGPEGVGRRTLALGLAKALNCLQPPAPGIPCSTCQACLQTERMQHPDLTVIQAEVRGGTLKVDQVRELQHSLSLAPYQGRYRVALLLRFEEANPSAANALLKTLEEPGPQVVLVLTAESAESLPTTIVSRCEVLRLRPLPLEQVSQGLQQRWQMEPGKAQLFAHISGGRPGYARRLSTDKDLRERRESWLNDLIHLVGASRLDRFTYAEALAKDKERALNVLPVWQSFWRDVMLRATGSSAPLVNLDRAEEIDKLASLFGLETAHCIIVALERTQELLKANINTRLAIEVLMLDLPRRSPG